MPFFCIFYQVILTWGRPTSKVDYFYNENGLEATLWRTFQNSANPKCPSLYISCIQQIITNDLIQDLSSKALACSDCRKNGRKPVQYIWEHFYFSNVQWSLRRFEKKSVIFYGCRQFPCWLMTRILEAKKFCFVMINVSLQASRRFFGPQNKII